jgi:hypothetical protein
MMSDSPLRAVRDGKAAARVDGSLCGGAAFVLLGLGVLFALSYPVVSLALVVGALAPGLIRRARARFTGVELPARAGRVDADHRPHS